MSDVQVICVDMDGTLIKNDLFVESMLRLIKNNPANIFLILYWLIKGKAYTKNKVAELIQPNSSTLLFEPQLVDYLKKKKEEGNEIVLATASSHEYAEAVSKALPIFSSIIGSTKERNLKGRHKLAAIREHIGQAPFMYAGDSAADRPIWKEAEKGIYVNAPKRDVNKAVKAGKADLIVESKPHKWRAFIKGMRIHQFAKNALIFVPMFTAHMYFNVDMLLTTFITFLLFSICASGVYFLNDLMDIESDRRHPSKKARPIASADLPIPLAVFGAVFLPLIAFAVSLLLLPAAFSWVMLTYYVLTNAYTFYLKRVPTADVMTLALLYTTRIVAGGASANVSLSHWLLIFSFFLFFSLAYLKRYIELAQLSTDGKTASGRGYSSVDKETVFVLGIATMVASVLVLALYVQSEDVISLYKSPELLFALCALMLFWGNRIWMSARRGEVDDDPVVFALKDKASRLILVGFVAVVLLATYI